MGPKILFPCRSLATTGAIRRAKLPPNRHHQQINTQLLTGWMPFPLPNQQCQSLDGYDDLLATSKKYDTKIQQSQKGTRQSTYLQQGQLNFNTVIQTVASSHIKDPDYDISCPIYNLSELLHQQPRTGQCMLFHCAICTHSPQSPNVNYW